MIADRLPNGFVVLVMSPREAVNIVDQLLDPEDYPWQGSEAQISGMQAKSLLREQIEKQATKDLSNAGRNLAKEAQEGEGA